MRVSEIDHQEMEHGRDWIMSFGRQIITPVGLRLLVVELRKRDFEDAAVSMEKALKNVGASEEDSPDEPVTEATPKSWTQQWEEEHE